MFKFPVFTFHIIEANNVIYSSIIFILAMIAIRPPFILFWSLFLFLKRVIIIILVIVECSGGTWTAGGKNWICVSSNTDRALWDGLKRKGATIVSTEFVLAGVLRQKIDINRNILLWCLCVMTVVYILWTIVKIFYKIAV